MGLATLARTAAACLALSVTSLPAAAAQEPSGEWYAIERLREAPA